MNIYERWLMRASGEKIHQPANAPERSTYAALNVLNRHHLLSDKPEILAEELLTSATVALSE